MYGSSVFRLAKTSSIRYYKNGSTKKLLEFLAEMPKVNTARIAEAQQQRQTISKKGEKYGPSTVYLQVLGSGARGVPNTLYLFTDQKRYLFNCGECTQRLAHEHKVKLSRLEHVFITSKTWRNIGGLPGLSLTLQDVGVPKITLHGPEGLDELYNATKRFVIMREMQVTMAPSSPTEDFEDNVMTIKYVHLSPQVSLLPDAPPKPCKRARLGEVPSAEYEQFTHDDTDYYSRAAEPVPKKKREQKRQSRSPEQREKKKSPSPTKEFAKLKNYSVAYICTLKKRLGTLDLTKCVEKGVRPGPLLGQLKSGLDVVLPDGTVVLSKDVKTPDDPGPVFIVIEVPDISYLNEAEFAAHFDNGTNSPENIPTLIVHMSPPEVYHHDDYKAFMAKFGQSTRHLIVNSQNSCLGSEAVHRTQHKLHLLDTEVFPLLKDPSIPAEWSPHPPIPKCNSPTKIKGIEDLKNRIAMAQFQNILNSEAPPKDAALQDEGSKLETYSSRTLTMFHLRPKRQIERSAEPKLHIQDYYQETMDVDGFVPSLEKFRGVAHQVRNAKYHPIKEYPKVVFLGTGSCIPSKTRNTSAIVVHVDDQRTVLLDCGEGTFGQLVRFYGPRKVDEVLRTMKAIYVSHLHADHHIGLIGVLQARAAAFADAPNKKVPLLLLAPGQIATWLTMYDRQFEKISGEFSLVPNQNLMEKEPGLTSAALAQLGLDALRTCLVPHCPNAFGVALTAAGHKITYSGDTLPTDNLVQIGENSEILIHEATMEDELAEEARVKMHSTTSQAIEVGRKMNAKYTVLTHFSQRYARLPRLNAQILNDNNTVGIAFDNMQVTLSDLPLLPHMYAPLQLMFAEHCVDMEMKAASRERRREAMCLGDEAVRRKSRGRSRCGSGSSSTTRSLTGKDTGKDLLKVRAASTDNAKSSGKASKKRWSSLSPNERESLDSNGKEVVNKDRQATPRYKENLTSRLRREHSGSNASSGTAIDIPRNTSRLSYRRPSSPYTAPTSRCTTPRSPSLEPRPTPAPASPAEDTAPVQKYASNGDLCEREQDFLSDVSNRPSRSLVNRKSRKSVSYDTTSAEKKTDMSKRHRSSVSKAYVLAEIPPPNLKSPLTRPSNAISGGSSVPMTSGVRATAGKKSMHTMHTPKSDIPLNRSSVRSHIPVLQKPVSPVNATKSYKPRLDNIESSFFILAKKQENEQSDSEKAHQQQSDRRKRIKDTLAKARTDFLRRSQPSEDNLQRPPPPIREDDRRMALRQAKLKFQSKEYRCQSKCRLNSLRDLLSWEVVDNEWYDKIEGLNWISWPQK